MTSVLITGGTGMLGANLAPRLVADGYRVHILARPDSDRIRLRAIADKVAFIPGNVTDPASLRKAVDQAAPQIVFHLASTPFNPPTATPVDHFNVNVLGTLHLLEAMRARPDATIVYTGTGAVYDAGSQSCEDEPLKPATLLGASKAAASTLLQTYARLHGTRTIELRLFMPYGPWEHPRRLIPQTILAALDGKDLPMSKGEQQRDLVYVDDVIDALVRASSIQLPPGTVLNIGSGIGMPIKEVVQSIFDIIGGKGRAMPGALPTRPDEIMVMSANIAKAAKCMNWRPQTSLEDGLRKTIAWVRAHRETLLNLGEGKRL
jgi:nucleoside-diphosphate-sugar epimerase